MEEFTFVFHIGVFIVNKCGVTCINLFYKYKNLTFKGNIGQGKEFPDLELIPAFSLTSCMPLGLNF